MEAYEYDPELGYMPAVPEPFWYCGWRTLFRWRPSCAECRTRFKTKSYYRLHYVLNHIAPQEDRKG